MSSKAKYYPEPSHGAARSNQQARGPATYDCVFCKRNLPTDAFSKTQLSKVTYNPWAPHINKKKQQQICCKQCSPGQTSSLTCMVCTNTKPLEGFAKAQRRNAEKARCLTCMQKYHDEDIYDSEEDSDDYGDGETWYVLHPFYNPLPPSAMPLTRLSIRNDIL